MQGNLHAQFLEGWAPAMGPGYSIRKSGTRTARRWCICQHEAEMGLGLVLRSGYTNARKRR